MKIAFLGDVALIGQYNDKNFNLEKLSELRNHLKNYDYVVANLESPLTNKSVSIIPKSMHLKSDPSNISILKYIGIDAVTLANNHIHDYGRQGVSDTITALEEAGIKWFGINNKCLKETICGEKVNFSGFCCLSTNGTGYEGHFKCGINLLTRDNLEKQISTDEEEGSISIMSIHFGIEHTNYPSLEHISLFENLYCTHPVIIHGHHPHVVQGIRKKNNLLIAYSLGNAIFDETRSINRSIKLTMNEDNKKGMILCANIIDRKIIGYETQGIYLSTEGVTLLDLEREINIYSEKIRSIKSKESYQLLRTKQYDSVIADKFGKHDLSWFFSRLNYYSIGAKLGAIWKKIEYDKIKRYF